MAQKGMEEANGYLGDDGEHFMVACNLPKNDEMWEDGTKEWLGKASMAKRHRFLTTKDLRWEWFNVLTFGLDGGLADAVELIERLRAAALGYARRSDGWSEENVELRFHVYGHASVPSLHLHVLDRRHLGPTHAALAFKNLSLDDALTVLREELAASKEAPAEPAAPPKPPTTVPIKDRPFMRGTTSSGLASGA